MTARRGKLVGLGAAGVGVVILLVAGFASKRPLLEKWYLSRLHSTNEETRKNAAKALGEYGSERSIRPLMTANFESVKPETDASIEKTFARLLSQQNRLTRRFSSAAGQRQNLSARRRQRSTILKQQASIDALVRQKRAEAATNSLMNNLYIESLTRITVVVHRLSAAE